MIRKLIQEILKEEIGRDFKTTQDQMMTYKKFPGIHVDIASLLSQGGFKVTITRNEDDKTITGFFQNYDEAEFFARNEATKLYNEALSQDTKLTVSKGFGPLGRGVER